MWAVCKNEKLLTYSKIQTRTCIDTRKELVKRGTLEDWWKTKKERRMRD